MALLSSLTGLQAPMKQPESSLPQQQQQQHSRRPNMKDLLKVSNDVMIVGLHDRVFVGSLQESDGDDDKELVVVELAPTTRAGCEPNTTSNSPVQAVALFCSDPVEPQQSINKDGNTTNSTTGTSNSIVWCAVARHDKSLAVYRMDQSAFTSTTVTAEASTTTRPIPVAVTHRTTKRASALCFATVPSSPTEEGPPLLVVIAADLAGDAVAFSTQHSSSTCWDDNDNNNNNNNTTMNEEPADPLLLGGTTVPHRRLLLGHTASMLTSVAVVGRRPWQPPFQILTADRDEKIRVSSFPHTHRIQGYLLGHTAFVACIDTMVVVEEENAGDRGIRCWCVSFGGDDTLRLWDCHTCRQLAMVSTATTSSTTTNNNNGNERSQPQQQQQSGADDATAATMQVTGDASEMNIDSNNSNNELLKNDESDNTRSKRRKPVPSKVTINARGDRIATICDESQKIYVWQVVTRQEAGQDKVDILPCGRFLCPSQPLAVSFYGNDQLLVLLCDPEYLKVYNIKSANGASDTITNDVQQRLRTKLRQVAAGIPMPASVLERDAFGNLKMQKMNEQRGNVSRKPWNDAQRKETNKERQKRVRKRKKEGI